MPAVARGATIGRPARRARSVLPFAFLLLGGPSSAAGQGPMVATLGGHGAGSDSDVAFGRFPPSAESPLDEARQRFERATAQKERLEAEIAGLVSQRSAARRRARTRLRALYRMKRAGMLPLAGGFEALLRHQSRVERLQRMVVRDVGALRSLGRRIETLQQRIGQLAGELEEAQARVSELAAHEEQRSRELAVLSQMIDDPAGWSGLSMSGGFGLRLSDGTDPRPDFQQQRGHLPLPVSGSARLSDAEREGGAGVELVATAGVSVRAVGAGRIAYAARHPGYGSLVIVDHEDGHYTVYGGLGAIAVRVGEPVLRDGVVGIVGDEPVFFQVRRGTRPLSAREWLGI